MPKGNEESPEECAKIAHNYFEQKRFKEALKYLKKIPKELLETEPYKEAKKEMNRIKAIGRWALMDFR